MKLARVTFLGVRGLADATYDFVNSKTGEPHPLLVITGPSASGKTRFLEALIAAKEVVAPYAMMVAPGPWLKAPDESAKIVLTWVMSDEERSFAGNDEVYPTTEALFIEDSIRSDIDEGVQTVLQRYEHDPRFGKLEYFPANRQVLPYGAPASLEAFYQRTQRADKDERKYSFIPRFLTKLRTNSELATKFATFLTYLSPSVRYAPTDEFEPWQCFDSGGAGAGSRMRYPVTELSKSESEAIIFAATAMAIEMQHSLVLVDRPDLHVDPAQAVAFVRGLGALGADNQIFIATQSREILASVDPTQIIHLGSSHPGSAHLGSQGA